MGLLDIFKRTERRSSDPSWHALTGGAFGLSQSGQLVNADSAQSITAVFAAVQALSESTAALPLVVWQRNDDGTRQRVDDHWLARVLARPNEYQSGFTFRESLTASVLLQGNGYARIERDGSGQVTALHPMDARAVTVVRLTGGRYRYDWSDKDGRLWNLLPGEVLHLADRTECDDIVGKSRIAIARDQIGLALAQREHGNNFYRRGAFPSGVLEVPADRQAFNDEQLGKLRSEWGKFSGSGNSGKTPILNAGITYRPLSMNMEDAQWLDAMKLTVEEVGRIFRINPIMLGVLDDANYSNAVAMSDQFIKYSLVRWIELWEQAIAYQLLGPIARRRVYADHDVEGMLRGNSVERANYYKVMIDAGVYSVDEARALEHLPPRGNDETTDTTKRA